MYSKWLVVATKANNENKAFENLKRQKFNVFFPRIKTESYKKDIKNEKLKPLFPGYIFVELQNFYGWSKINNTYGVLKIVKFGDSPALLKENTYKNIKNKCDENDIFFKNLLLKTDDKVRILKPGSSPIEAIFKEHIDSKRSFILLNILSREFKLSVEKDLIQAL